MTSEPAVTLATDALARVVDALAGGEPRPGQREMAAAVAEAVATETPLIVQAGTGTGKSLAYLVPAVALGAKVLVATATKALQDQLATKDAPQVAAVLGDFGYAVLKGRQNYVCHQKLDELHRAPDLFGGGARLADVVAWADASATGEVAELEDRFDRSVLDRIVTSSDECTGPRCPRVDACRANEARARADAAQVVIVNQHLLGADVQASGGVLPEWDVLIVDEAHELEDVMAQALGDEVGPGRIRRVLGAVTDLLADADDLRREVGEAADRVADALDALDLPDGQPTRRFPDGLASEERLPGLLTALIERRAGRPGRGRPVDGADPPARPAGG